MTLPIWCYAESDPVVHTMSFLTDILPAATAFEQRRKLRLSPRHRISSAFLFDGNQRRRMEMALARYAGSEWELPLPMFGQALGALLASGASSIPAETADRAFVDGGRALLLNQQTRAHELVEIDTVEADALTLVDPTAAAWPAGSMLYPLRRARLVDAPALGLFTDAISYGDTEFELTEPLDWAAYTWPAEYRGAPVFDQCANAAASDPVVGLPRRLLTVDVMSGVQSVYDLPAVTLPTLQMAIDAEGREDIADLYAMLYDLKGCLRSVWISSRARDLEPVASAGSGATSIDVEACGLDDADLPATRRDIRIQFPGGAVVYRRITNVTTPAPGTERITLDSALGTAIAPGDGTVISWLWLARQSADVNALGYWTGDVVETTLQFEGINHDL